MAGGSPHKQGVRERLSYANVMATLALFVALGGVGYAASKLPRDSVGAKQIKENAVRASEQAPDSVDGSNLIDGSVGAGDLGSNSVEGTSIADGTVGIDDLASDSVNSGKIADGSVAPGDLASDQATIGPTLENCDGLLPWGIGGGGSAPGYWIDAHRVVHLQGAVACSGNATEGGAIFSMPQAYRPQIQSTVVRFGVLGGGTELAQVAVITTASGAALVYDAPNDSAVDNFVNLDGITYRAVGPVP
jgi:hypothetical protein